MSSDEYEKREKINKICTFNRRFYPAKSNKDDLVLTKKINNFKISINYADEKDGYIMITVCSLLEKNQKKYIVRNYTAWDFNYEFKHVFEQNHLNLDIFLNEIIYELL